MAAIEMDLLPERFAICSVPLGSDLTGVLDGPLPRFVVRTADEVSIVLPAGEARDDWRSDTAWRCFRLRGPLQLELHGILASVLTPLADAQIPVFPVASFDTDFVLVRSERTGDALDALAAAGHLVYQPE